ncbi:MAG TPA: protein translocase subunit SecD, partial [Gammaproteobacteria bacterium]|nr:protein translocase subunit SecD [Gammaproteobacteria bacterium]
MLNRYPMWKYILICIVLLTGIIYASPNLFGDDPAIQISATRGASVNTGTLGKLEALLENNQIKPKSVVLEKGAILIRMNDTETQLKAQDLIRDMLGNQYIVALNLAPATPAWLSSINALPMYLGLDLRGGVHFLMQVDMDAAITQSLERYKGDFRTIL